MVLKADSAGCYSRSGYHKSVWFLLLGHTSGLEVQLQNMILNVTDQLADGVSSRGNVCDGGFHWLCLLP